jgi:hypothetical protein
MRFTDTRGRTKVFIITKIDSLIKNKKGWFINEEPCKLLTSSLKELGKDTVRLKRVNEFFVNRDPSKEINTIGIQFNNFYFHGSILPQIHQDSMTLNNRKFTNYYQFESSLGLEDADDVKVLYINTEKGFLGFKTLSGEAWLNKVYQ